jgi:hypothetical protein
LFQKRHSKATGQKRRVKSDGSKAAGQKRRVKSGGPKTSFPKPRALGRWRRLKPTPAQPGKVRSAEAPGPLRRKAGSANSGEARIGGKNEKGRKTFVKSRFGFSGEGVSLRRKNRLPARRISPPRKAKKVQNKKQGAGTYRIWLYYSLYLANHASRIRRRDCPGR